jgi:hypothetical protein
MSRRLRLWALRRRVRCWYVLERLAEARLRAAYDALAETESESS